jgi:hypothetical protein
MIIAAVISVIVGVMLGLGVDNMKEKHPDYKGEDFLNWDDDKVHTEDKI